MNNAAIIAQMSARMIRSIEHRMSDIGETYEVAAAHVREASCGGPAVWEVIEAHFAKCAAVTPVTVAKIENFRLRLDACRVELISGFVLINAAGEIWADDEGRPHAFRLKRIAEKAASEGLLPGATFVKNGG